MRRLSFFVAVALLAPCAAASADTLSNFTIDGSSLFYGMGGDTNTLTGATTIDVTTGVIEAISFTAGGVYETGVDAQYGTDIFVGPDAAKFTISGTSLVDFSGDNFNLNGPNDLYVGQVSYAGAFTPAAVTPEPASMVLLGTGLLGLAGVMRRRFA